MAERAADGAVVGCGALHVMWEDLAEIRTVAVRPGLQGHGIGHRLVAALLGSAREVGVRRVFVLTFATGFFGRHGFAEIDGTPVSPEVYDELLRSYDEGVAEFLDLDRVKPNTLGNTACCCICDIGAWSAAVPGRARRGSAGQGRSGEVASLISWLLGPDGGWVTGQVLSPNGGVVLGR